MKCSCPKCNANIQVDLPHVPENGIATPCPECNGRFWINKESFACRALKKEGKLYCAQCSTELNHQIVCPSCGVLFPDFCVVQTSKPVKRQLKKSKSTISFSLRPSQQKTPGISTSGKSSSKPRKSLITIVSLLLLAVVLSAVSVVAYNKWKAEQEFTSYFVLAVYGIKTGADSNLNRCAKISADWRTKMTAGQNFQPRINPEDASRVNKVKVEVDAIMQRLDKPPKQFITANAQLAKLYGVYAQLHALTLEPPGSLAGFTDLTAKSEYDFRQALKELKATLPTELAEEIEKAKTKYKGLRDF